MSQQPGLGQINRLQVTDIGTAGLRLDCADLEPEGLGDRSFDFVVLPTEEKTKDVAVGDSLDVFLYLDSEDELVATLKTPTISVGECAFLKVLSTGKFGAFLDWGLAKDLLLPHSEQAYPVREGGSYVVYAYLNEESGRVVATTLLHHFLEEEANQWIKKGQQVELLIAAKSELGYKAVIDGTHLGLIYHEGLSQPLKFGTKMKGWIQNIRDDGRIDLSINTLDKETRDELSNEILEKLKLAGGRLELSDKSAPEDIFQEFSVSKKNFKRAISGLYKQRLIKIYSSYIELL